MSKSKGIVCPNISSKVMENIESRSRVLSKQFWNLEYEDLLHDGIVLVMEIRNKKPDCTDPYLFGAINHYYSDVMKKAVEYKKNRRELGVNTDWTKSVAIEDELDRKFSNIDSNDKDDALAVELVKGYGLSKKELVEVLGTVKTKRRRNEDGT